MKKQAKGFLMGLLVATLLMNTAVGETVKKSIEVVYNSVNLIVNGEKVNADNILYNGTTYVPLRSIAEMLGKEVGWDQETNTASIDDKTGIPVEGNEKVSKEGPPLTKTVTTGVEIYENEHELELFTSKLGYYIYKRPYDFVIKEFERHDEYRLDNPNLDIEVGFSIFLMDDTVEEVKKQVIEDLNKRFVNVSEQQVIESPIKGVFIESFGDYVGSFEEFDYYDYPMEKHYITEKNGRVFHIKVVMEDFLEGTEDIIEMTLKEFNIM